MKWHRVCCGSCAFPYNKHIRNKPMTTINKDHWKELYNKLYDAYELCCKNDDDTYLYMVGQILDHMNRNEKFQDIK